MCAAVADPRPVDTPSPASQPQRGHHVEFYLQSFAGRPKEREEEAEKWRQAGVNGSFKVYYLNLLLISLAVVQVKGALSWKMRETAGAGKYAHKMHTELDKLSAEVDKMNAETDEIFAKADAELEAMACSVGVEANMRQRTKAGKDTKDD